MGTHDFTIGQDDNNVPWDQAIVDEDGNLIDITGATVKLHYRIADKSAAAVEVNGVVVGTFAGQDQRARAVFLAANTAVADVFDAEWIITLLSGELVTFPACAGRAKQTFEVFPKR